jgi:secreted trypsin-like serine protease
MPIISQAACRNTYGASSGLNPTTMICAGNGNGRDVCLGDNGGPLVVRETELDGRNLWYLVGITSWRYGCGNTPSVYTRVQSFNSWMSKVISDYGGIGK